MRSLLFFVVLAVGGIVFLKGNVNLTHDDHVRGIGPSAAGLGIPNLFGGGSQISAVFGMATSMLAGAAGQTQPIRPAPIAMPNGTQPNGTQPSGVQPNGVQTGATPGRPPASKPPAMPQVTSATGTYIPPGANVTTGIPAPKGGDTIIPPESMRFLPSPQGNAPQAGAQNLSPAQTQLAQERLVQSKANPAATKDRFEAAAKALRGQQ